MSNEPLLGKNYEGANSPSGLSPTIKPTSAGLTLRTTANNRNRLLGNSSQEATTFKRPGVLGSVKNRFKPLTHEPQRKQQLLEAIQKGNTEEALRIIQTSGIDVNSIIAVFHGIPMTALMVVSANARRDIVNALIAAGANVNATDKYGDTALMHAISQGFEPHLEIVNILIAAGADVNAVGRGGNTAVIAASEYAKLNIVNALIAAGADVNATNKDGNTALTVVSKVHHVDLVKGRDEIVKALIAAGANVNATDEDGSTPLMSAKNLEIVKALIAAGANVNATNKGGFTALMSAKNLEIVNVLIAAGADVNIRSRNGYTALMSASYGGHLEVVKALIAKGANVNVIDIFGNTPLMYASKRGNREIENALIAAGAKKKGLLFGFRGGRKTRKNKAKKRKDTRHRR